MVPAGFDAVGGDVGVRGVGNLFEGFAGAADFDEIFAVDEEVAGGGDVEGVSLAELGGEEGFAEGSDVGAGG